MDWKYCTGGRERYYKAINVRDCATRAIAIANDMDYKEAYKLMWKFNNGSPRNGVNRSSTDKCLLHLGWQYKNIESKNVYANEFEKTILQKYSVIIVRIKGHIATFMNGCLYDTWNSIKNNPKIIGYWVKTV